MNKNISGLASMLIVSALERGICDNEKPFIKQLEREGVLTPMEYRLISDALSCEHVSQWALTERSRDERA